MNQIKLVSVLLSAIILAGTGEAVAQNDSEPHSKVQVSFFPPLGTNGLHSGRYTNDFSFNLLAGVSKNERAFALAGLANIIRNDATGFQLAGIVNCAGGEGRGFQLGGLANIVGGGYRGFQHAGLANIARDVRGVQFSGLANVADDVRGFQFAGLANIARDVYGFQFGGLFNVARNVHGVQFAGLVNIAEKSDYPIGIVNIIREGEMGVSLGYNEIGTTALAFRSGGRVLYGILGLGYNHKADKKEAASIVGGYGAHINIQSWLRINNELTMESFGIFSNRSSTFKTGYALMPAFRPVRCIEIFGGPSINYMYSAEEDMFGIFPGSSLWEKESTRRNGDRKLQQVFVGWQVGVQYIF